MNFYETKYGRSFFEHQLPKLTNALESIATALTQKPPKVQIPMDISSEYLMDVYHGKLEPDAERSDLGVSKPLDKAVETLYWQLKEQASPKLWQQIVAYRTALEERTDYYMDHAFATGYRTAMRLVAAGLIPSTEIKKDGAK